MKIFLGSTVKKIEGAMRLFLEREGICVGNYIDAKLYKHGGVYQMVLLYAALIKQEA